MTIALALSWLKSAFSGAVEFCSKPPGSWIAAALAVAAALWWYGQHEFNRGAASVTAKDVAALAHVQVAQREITVKASIEFHAIHDADLSDTARRVKEVPLHVSAKADAGCIVPVGAVRVLDDAFHGPVPGPAAGADDSPSGIALSEATQTVVQVAGQYDVVAHQLTALQDWIRQQQALSEK